ncbi:MAG TPA: response regulator transcription factor [Dehalococcoidia bacterium]|jgi:DNA-binding response OmpR family regulator|nr:response regulator transcription factor [Dehalococcoidia bacterium]
MTRFTPHVIVCDDDPAILAAVSRILQLNGYFVVSCSDGETALRLFDELTPSLVVSNLRMPRMDGITLVERIREVSTVPILILTGVAEEGEAARALEAGADDYVRKPFGAVEFLARVRAVMRRARTTSSPSERLSNGVITLDEGLHQVFVYEREVALSRTEFAVLEFLLSSRGRVLTHDQILTAVWGPEFGGSHHLLRVCMSRLRKKLGPDGSTQIESLPGFGYRLKS